MNNAKKIVADALASGPGSHLGDVVWMSFGAVHSRRSDIRSAFGAQGLPAALAPEDVSVEHAFGAAVNGFKDKGGRLFLRRADARRKGSDVMLVEQVSNAGGLDTFNSLGRIGLDSGNSVVPIKGPGWNAAADNVYYELASMTSDRLEYANTTELSSSVIGTLLNWCGGLRLRDRGGVYWAHKQCAAEVRALSAVVEQFGSSNLSVLPVHDHLVYVCPIHGAEIRPNAGPCSICGTDCIPTREAHRAVSRAAAESFGEELRVLTDEVTTFGKVDARVSTMERRIEDFESLRNRVDLYGDILANKRDTLLAGLDAAKDALRKLIVAAEIA